MRKDNFSRENIAPVYTQYHVEGLNQNKLLNALIKKGVCLYNIKKTSPKSMTFCVNVKENKKFFAIVKKMWYTTDSSISLKEKRKREKLFQRGVIATKKECGYLIQRQKTKGRGYPFYYLLANVGVALGLLVFVFGATFCNDFILSFNFTGNGKILQRQVEEYFSQNGVKKFSRFSSFDLARLSREIQAQTPMLSFAQCSKRGNRLVVELVLASSAQTTLDQSVKELKSDVTGVITSIRVHRGTPLFAVGDRVNEGDLLVEGFVDYKDQRIEVNVLATVVVLAEYQHEYLSEFDNREVEAELFAKTSLNKDCESATIEKIQTENGYLYKTTLYYKRFFVAG